MKNGDDSISPEDGEDKEDEDEDEDEKSSCTSRFKRIPMLGILLAFVSSLFFCFCNIIVQKVKLDPFTIAFYRFIGIALSSFPIVIYGSQTVPKGKWWLLLFRSFLGVTNLIIHFYGLKHMPMADANMIAAAAPIWCVIFARIFLKEAIRPFDIFNTVLTFAGIVFIIRPPFLFGGEAEYSDNYLYAAIALFCGSLMQANVYIVLRLLKGVHYSVTLSVFGSIGVAESGVFMLTLGDGCLPQCGYDRWMMMLIGIISFVAQILLTVSIQVEEAGKISLVRKSGDILFAFLFQMLIFQIYPGIWSIIGAVLIGLAVILSSVKKLVDTLDPSHPIKSRYLRKFYPPPMEENPLELSETNHLVNHASRALTTSDTSTSLHHQNKQ